MRSKYLRKSILLFAITCILSFLPSRSSAFTYTSSYTEDAASFIFTVIAGDFDVSDIKVVPPFDVGGPDVDWDFSFFFSFSAGPDDEFSLGSTIKHSLGGGSPFTLKLGPTKASDWGIGTHLISLESSFFPSNIQSHGSYFDILSGELAVTVGAGDQITALSVTMTGTHTPEPGTVMLLGAGLLGLGLAGRIRQKPGGANPIES